MIGSIYGRIIYGPIIYDPIIYDYIFWAFSAHSGHSMIKIKMCFLVYLINFV